MPHFIIDCSKNITEKLSPDKLVREVYQSAESSNLFDKDGVGGIKVRINSYEHYLNVGSQDDFIHVFGNIMEGRTISQKSNLSKMIVLKLKSLFPDVPIISMNIREFEKATYCNKSMV